MSFAIFCLNENVFSDLLLSTKFKLREFGVRKSPANIIAGLSRRSWISPIRTL